MLGGNSLLRRWGGSGTGHRPPIPGGTPHQVGWDFGQPDMVRVPLLKAGAWNRVVFKMPPTQAILRFYELN